MKKLVVLFAFFAFSISLFAQSTNYGQYKLNQKNSSQKQ